MPDPLLSEAIREAYASADQDDVILETLELRHPSFTNTLRIVNNGADPDFWRSVGLEEAAVINALPEDQQRYVGLVAHLEPDAVENGDALVPFIAFGFEIILPEVESAPLTEFSIKIDDVSLEVSDALFLAATSQSPTIAVYRPYLLSDLSGPQMLPPPSLSLSDASMDAKTVTVRARLLDIGNKAFPGLTYSVERFPGLAW